MIKGISVTRELDNYFPVKCDIKKLIHVSRDTGGVGNSTLIRLVCATSVLNLSPCSGVEKPKKYTLFWSYCSFLYCIVLYCIVLYCIVLYCIVLYCIVLYCIALYCIMFMLYFFNQMILPFHFTSFMLVQEFQIVYHCYQVKL